MREGPWVGDGEGTVDAGMTVHSAETWRVTPSRTVNRAAVVANSYRRYVLSFSLFDLSN